MELKLEKGDCHPARERKKRIKPFGFKHGQSKEFVNEDKKKKVNILHDNLNGKHVMKVAVLAWI